MAVGPGPWGIGTKANWWLLGPGQRPPRPTATYKRKDKLTGFFAEELTKVDQTHYLVKSPEAMASIAAIADFRASITNYSNKKGWSEYYFKADYDEMLEVTLTLPRGTAKYLGLIEPANPGVRHAFGAKAIYVPDDDTSCAAPIAPTHGVAMNCPIFGAGTTCPTNDGPGYLLLPIM